MFSNIGRRTLEDVRAGKKIGRHSDGFERFEDYWTDSEHSDDESVSSPVVSEKAKNTTKQLKPLRSMSPFSSAPPSTSSLHNGPSAVVNPGGAVPDNTGMSNGSPPGADNDAAVDSEISSPEKVQSFAGSPLRRTNCISSEHDDKIVFEGQETGSWTRSKQPYKRFPRGTRKKLSFSQLEKAKQTGVKATGEVRKSKSNYGVDDQENSDTSITSRLETLRSIRVPVVVTGEDQQKRIGSVTLHNTFDLQSAEELDQNDNLVNPDAAAADATESEEAHETAEADVTLTGATVVDVAANDDDDDISDDEFVLVSQASWTLGNDVLSKDDANRSKTRKLDPSKTAVSSRNKPSQPERKFANRKKKGKPRKDSVTDYVSDSENDVEKLLMDNMNRSKKGGNMSVKSTGSTRDEQNKSQREVVNFARKAKAAKSSAGNDVSNKEKSFRSSQRSPDSFADGSNRSYLHRSSAMKKRSPFRDEPSNLVLEMINHSDQATDRSTPDKNRTKKRLSDAAKRTTSGQDELSEPMRDNVNAKKAKIAKASAKATSKAPVKSSIPVRQSSRRSRPPEEFWKVSSMIETDRPSPSATTDGALPSVQNKPAKGKHQKKDSFTVSVEKPAASTDEDVAESHKDVIAEKSCHDASRTPGEGVAPASAASAPSAVRKSARKSKPARTRVPATTADAASPLSPAEDVPHSSAPNSASDDGTAPISTVAKSRKRKNRDPAKESHPNRKERRKKAKAKHLANDKDKVANEGGDPVPETSTVEGAKAVNLSESVRDAETSIFSDQNIFLLSRGNESSSQNLPPASKSSNKTSDYSTGEADSMTQGSSKNKKPSKASNSRKTKPSSQKDKSQAKKSNKRNPVKHKEGQEEEERGNSKMSQSSELNPGLRKSRRRRVQTLQWWKNEHITYEMGEDGLSMVGIASPVTKIPEVSQKKPKKKTKTKSGNKNEKLGYTKSMRKLSMHVAPPEGEVGGIDDVWVLNPLNGQEEVRVECIKLYDDYKFVGPTGEQAKDDDPLTVAKSLNQLAFASGELIIRPLQEKSISQTKQDTIVFRLLRGRVKITIHTSACILQPGDSFFVPPGNIYSIVNLRNDDAEFCFVQLKGGNPT